MYLKVLVQVHSFSTYTAVQYRDIVNPPLTLHGFVHDHTVGNKFKPGDWGDEARCMCELVKCVTNLKVWMNENRLKMNSNKTRVHSFWIKTAIG